MKEQQKMKNCFLYEVGNYRNIRELKQLDNKLGTL